MKKSFGHKLRLLRQNNNLTQHQLAELIKISRSQLAKLEAEIVTPTPNIIKHISLNLGVPIDWLLDDTCSSLDDWDLSEMTTTNEFLTDSLLTKFNLLNNEYKQCAINQVEQLLSLQLKITQKKESPE